MFSAPVDSESIFVKSSRYETNNGTIAISSHVLFFPNLVLVLSDRFPTIGSENMFHTTPIVSIAPAHAGLTPVKFVRKNSRNAATKSYASVSVAPPIE